MNAIKQRQKIAIYKHESRKVQERQAHKERVDVSGAAAVYSVLLCIKKLSHCTTC